jgi:uncharacterized protein
MTTPLQSAQARLLASLPGNDDGQHYPVEQWNPAHCGHSGMQIDSEGRWYHEGTLIARPAMVALFAKLLRREDDGSHVLVTPAEKLTIDVEGAPLIATEMRRDGTGEAQSVAFHIQHFGWVVAGPAHPLQVRQAAAGPAPLVMGPRGLQARLARPVYYELAELALAGIPELGKAGIWSGGQFFALEAE